MHVEVGFSLVRSGVVSSTSSRYREGLALHCPVYRHGYQCMTPVLPRDETGVGREEWEELEYRWVRGKRAEIEEGEREEEKGIRAGEEKDGMDEWGIVTVHIERPPSVPVLPSTPPNIGIPLFPITPILNSEYKLQESHKHTQMHECVPIHIIIVQLTNTHIYEYIYKGYYISFKEVLVVRRIRHIDSSTLI